MLCSSQTSHTRSSVFWTFTFQCELNDISFLLYRELYICNPLTMWQKVGKGVSSPQAQVLVSTGDKSHGSFPKIYQSRELKPGYLFTVVISDEDSFCCSLYWGVSREYTICPIHPMISVSWEVSLTMTFQLCPPYPHKHSFHFRFSLNLILSLNVLLSRWNSFHMVSLPTICSLLASNTVLIMFSLNTLNAFSTAQGEKKSLNSLHIYKLPTYLFKLISKILLHTFCFWICSGGSRASTSHKSLPIHAFTVLSWIYSQSSS